MSTTANSGPCTAFALISDAIQDLYRAADTDTDAVLLAGWNGFTMLATTTAMLVEQAPDPDRVPERLILVRNNNVAACTVAIRYLEKAPALPPTRTPQPMSEWASLAEVTARAPVPYDIRLWPSEKDDRIVDRIGWGLAESQMPVLSSALNLRFSTAAKHATDRADRKALQVGTAMSTAISECWQGRLRTYFATTTSLERIAVAAGESPWTAVELQQEQPLIQLLREAIARCSAPDGWASTAAIGIELHLLDPDFWPDAYGYTGLARLLSATQLFQIRSVQHGKSYNTIKVRERRPHHQQNNCPPRRHTPQ